MERQRVSVHVFDLCTVWMVDGQLIAQTAVPREILPWYPVRWDARLASEIIWTLRSQSVLL